MPLTPTQRRFLRELNQVDTRYLVIGGHAMRAHGIARETTDLDIFISQNPADLDKIGGALVALDARLILKWPAARDQLTRPFTRVVLPDPRHPEIDLLSSFEGLEFGNANRRRHWLELDGLWCHVAAPADLIALKRVSEAKCLADAHNASLPEAARREASKAAEVDRADITQLERLG